MSLKFPAFLQPVVAAVLPPVRKNLARVSVDGEPGDVLLARGMDWVAEGAQRLQALQPADVKAALPAIARDLPGQARRLRDQMAASNWTDQINTALSGAGKTGAETIQQLLNNPRVLSFLIRNRTLPVDVRLSLLSRLSALHENDGVSTNDYSLTLRDVILDNPGPKSASLRDKAVNDLEKITSHDSEDLGLARVWLHLAQQSPDTQLQAQALLKSFELLVENGEEEAESFTLFTQILETISASPNPLMSVAFFAFVFHSDETGKALKKYEHLVKPVLEQKMGEFSQNQATQTQAAILKGFYDSLWPTSPSSD